MESNGEDGPSGVCRTDGPSMNTNGGVLNGGDVGDARPQKIPSLPTRKPSSQAKSSSNLQPVFEPPVTKNTLSELDVNKIVNNPKLRHDINHDPDLHFRPNLDGEKGRKKTQKAKEFWDTMEYQLNLYIQYPEKFEKEFGGTEWALPTTLTAIRGILETLVPQRDRPAVINRPQIL